jgi:hypothetical protein
MMAAGFDMGLEVHKIATIIASVMQPLLTLASPPTFDSIFQNAVQRDITPALWSSCNA